MPRRIPSKALPHLDTSFTPYIGNSGKGRTFGPKTPVERALVVQKVQLVRNSAGEQVTSTTQVYTDASNLIPANSLYTIFGSTSYKTTSSVIAVAHYDHPRLEGLIVVYLE